MPLTKTQEDRELIKLLQQGNVAAFDSLFEVYSSKLFGFGFKYLKNESDAEELVQDVFIKVWENRKNLQSELSFRSYLFTIALNQIRKHFNKKASSLRYLQSLQHDSFLSDESSAEEYQLTLQRLYHIIDQMPSRRREIFVKSKLEGKSSKEVAAELNITAGTVDNQVSESLRFIREHMKSGNIEMILFIVLFLS